MTESFLKYLQYEKRLSFHTLKAYQTDLEQFSSFLEKNFPEYKAHHADYGVVRAWIIHLVERGIESLSVNRKIACLRTFFKFLCKEEIISKDPMSKISILKTSKKLPSFVKETDMINLLDHVTFPETFDGLRDKLMIELFYATGIRLSELVTLKENKIDLVNRTIKVLGKRNKERVIPFATGIVHTIQEYKDARDRAIGQKGHGFFFVTDKGEPCYPMMVYRTVKRYLNLYTSSEKVSPHVLRHTYATHLLDRGAEINAVKDLLGHTSLAATQVYTHNSMDKLKKVFDQAHPKA
jgi:integrase/recombinase XerC